MASSLHWSFDSIDVLGYTRAGLHHKEQCNTSRQTLWCNGGLHDLLDVIHMERHVWCDTKKHIARGCDILLLNGRLICWTQFLLSIAFLLLYFTQWHWLFCWVIPIIIWNNTEQYPIILFQFRKQACKRVYKQSFTHNMKYYFSLCLSLSLSLSSPLSIFPSLSPSLSLPLSPSLSLSLPLSLSPSPLSPPLSHFLSPALSLPLSPLSLSLSLR